MGAYIGNPTGFDVGSMLYNSLLMGALRSPRMFSGATTDHFPKLVVARAMFGKSSFLPIPDAWLHNLPVLARGPERCTLLVHSDDAQRLGLADGGHATVRSRVGEVRAQVEVTDDMMPGVGACRTASGTTKTMCASTSRARVSPGSTQMC